jgi:hypothetical protein
VCCYRKGGVLDCLKVGRPPGSYWLIIRKTPAVEVNEIYGLNNARELKKRKSFKGLRSWVEPSKETVSVGLRRRSS